MRRRFEPLVSTLALALVVTAIALGDDEGGFLSLFDGRTLEGWTREHTDRFSVRDGVIVNNGGSGWLRYNKPFRDFELRAEYRALRKGADSGLLFRASAESTSKAPHWPARGYQLQVVDARGNGAILGFGVAPPKYDRKPNVVKDVMKGPGQWQTITLRVVGSHAEATLNGVTITVCDSIERREGCIGLQGENGHFEWRNLKIREVPEH
jgi:hypothetical protein